MIKKIITALLIIAVLWFFVGHTLNYGMVNMKRTEAEGHQYMMETASRRWSK